MPRDGAVVLSDLRSPTVSIVCEPCGHRGTYNVGRLMEQHGDAKLPDLLQTLANCPKARSPISMIGAGWCSGSGSRERLGGLDEHDVGGAPDSPLQGCVFGSWPTPSSRWLLPGSQFHEARSLCQSRHAVRAAVTTTAIAMAANNATIIAMIARRVSVIEVRRCVDARSAAGHPDQASGNHSPCERYREAFKRLAFH
jgi:hypothetical protein